MASIDGPASRSEQTAPVLIHRIGAEQGMTPDLVAVEEPLAIRLQAGDTGHQLATTMRTPGADDELAVGWLASEGLIRSRRDIVDITWCVRHEGEPEQHGNVVTVTLRAEHLPALDHLARHGVVTSACGVCGRTTIDALADAGISPVPLGRPTTWDALATAAGALRDQQPVFAVTGGLHAAARVRRDDGTIVAAREDVGRHNAVDKLIGAALLDDDDLSDELLLLSSRASYELLQKAAMARIGVVVAVGAASSLAIEVADRFQITLIGFLRPDGANVYTHPERITAPQGASPEPVLISRTTS